MGCHCLLQSTGCLILFFFLNSSRGTLLVGIQWVKTLALVELSGEPHSLFFVHASLAASMQDGYEINCRHMRNKMRGLFPSLPRKTDGPSCSLTRLSEREERLGKQTDSWCFRGCPAPRKIHLSCLRPGRARAQASVSSSGKARLPRGHGMSPGQVHRAPPPAPRLKTRVGGSQCMPVTAQEEPVGTSGSPWRRGQ